MKQIIIPRGNQKTYYTFRNIYAYYTKFKYLSDEKIKRMSRKLIKKSRLPPLI